MSNVLEKESLRALRASESFYSQETEMIHLSYKERPFKKADTIPLYHNFLFGLALLQNRERETMQKGISLIDHLLCFQIKEGEDSGAFPRYVHEYPKIERHYEVVDILLPLIWIYRDFKAIFPEEIRSKVLNSIKIGADYLFKFCLKNEPSYLLNIQLGCLFKTLGKMLKNENWIQDGETRLCKLFSSGSDKSWGSSRHLSKMLLYLGLLSIEEAPYISLFYHFVKHSWHKSTESYLGPGINEHLFENRQEPTLYHDFLSKEFHQKPVPLFEADVMETVLLKRNIFKNDFIKKESLKYSLYPFEVEDTHFEDMGFSFFNLPEMLWEKRGGFYPFKLLIESEGKDPNSFVLHMGSFVQIEKLSKTSLLLTFENSKDKELDISFYGNLSSNVKITSENKKAAMFDLSSPIEFDYDSYKIVMSFPHKEKNIWAQLCHGNRRSQIIKDFNKTYDWNLYFRQIDTHASQPFLIQLEIIKK